MLRPKKNSYKEFDEEKKFLRLENSPPPHNFSNGPSLNSFSLPPHPGYCGAFAHLVSPGGGAFANFALPGGRAFANPGAIPKAVS